MSDAPNGFAIRIDGDHPVIPILRREFRQPGHEYARPCLELLVRSTPLEHHGPAVDISPGHGVISRATLCTEGLQLHFKTRAITDFYRSMIYWPRTQGEAICMSVSSCVEPPRSSFDELVQRWASWAYLTRLEALAYSIGNLVETLVSYFLPHDAFMIHSACVGLEGQPLLLSGKSNAGKTTLNTLFMGSHGSSYYAEDMAYLQGGVVWPNLRTYRLYPDTLVSNPLLATKMSWMGASDRLHFKLRRRLRGNRGVRRLRSPLDFWGEGRMGHQERPRFLFVLQREDHNTHGVRVKEVRDDWITERLVSNTTGSGSGKEYYFDVFNRAAEFERLVGREVVDIIGRRHERYTGLVSEMVKDAECFRVEVGTQVTAAELTDRLHDVCLTRTGPGSREP